MKDADAPSIPRAQPAAYRLLEWAASAVLKVVLGAVGWMIAVAYFPEWGRLASVELEVMVILGLLVAALGIVSVVALLHTRK
jgi:hypothetical protein